MYLFTRTLTAKSDRAADALAFAVDISAAASSVGGLEVSAWSVLYGGPLTTVTWTASVASHAAMGAVGDKLQADPGYMEKATAAGDLFEGAAEDALIDMVAMVGDGGHQGEYAALVQAQCAPGRIAEAMAWGVDILNHVGGLTGRDGVFGRSMYGPWGGVGWITLAASLDQVDAANEAMAADASYLERVDAAGALFVSGETSQRLSRRIA